MKRTLLTGTALATAGMLAASPVSAEMAISAYMNFGFGLNDTDEVGGGPSRDGHGFSTNSEIAFTNSMKTDDGLDWGWTIQVEGDAADGNTDPDASGGTAGNIDEAYMWVSGKFGKVTLGSNDGGADPEMDGCVYCVSGQNGENNQGIDGSLKQSTTQRENSLTSSGDASKIMYTSPRVMGARVEVSYMPDNATIENEWAGNIDYVLPGGIEGVDVNVKLTGISAGLAANQDGDKDNRTQGYNIGLALDMEGWKLETGYFNQNHGNYANGGDDDSGWTIGAGYGTGPWSANITYGSLEEEVTNDQWEAWSVGGRYTLAKGLALTAAALVAEDTAATVTNNYEEYSLTVEMSF